MTAEMAASPTRPSSPQLRARVAGVLYLFVIVGAVVAPFAIAPSGLMRGEAGVPSAATILASPSRYALGGVLQLVVYACDVVIALIFYELLAPVSRSLARLASAFRVAFAAIASANLFNHFAALALVGGSTDHGAFGPGQLEALALLFVRLRTFGLDVALVFFGVHCLLTGYLLFRSTFFPRILGVGMAIAGVGYVANILVTALPPGIAARLFPYVLLPAGLAEIALAVWLVAVGLNVSRWEELTRGVDDGG